MPEDPKPLCFSLIYTEGEQINCNICGSIFTLSHMIFEAMNGNNDIAKIVLSACVKFTEQEKFKQT